MPGAKMDSEKNMLQRKLLIINILVITLALALITFSAVRELRYLLFRENTLSYNNLILQDCNQLQEIFDTSQDRLLTICSNRQLHELLEEETFDYEKISKLCDELRSTVGVDEVDVFPVFEDDVYYPNPMGNGYSLAEEGLFDYDISNNYTWSRPEDRDCIRVSRPIFSASVIV